MWIKTSTTTALTPTAIALGNFDGVHLGHTAVIVPILTCAIDLIPTVVTFNPHPKEFFSGESRLLLTPTQEKAEQLQKLGVKQLILLPFDRELAALTPQDFVERILIGQLQAKRISIGADFCFGYRRQGNAYDLQNLAQRWGVEVIINPLQTLTTRISSSEIRQALGQGNLETVTAMLGRPYHLQGKVIHGQHLGKTLGFPTANLEISPEKFLPRTGVYAVLATRENSSPQAGVMNIGYRPTLEGKSLSIEVHLFNWNQDLYGQGLAVDLMAFLRPEQKFSSLAALQSQISQDCRQAQKILNSL